MEDRRTVVSYIKPGLTVEAASSICIERCGAQCCQGPLILCLSAEEKRAFKHKADQMGMSLNMTSLGQSWLLKFQDHEDGCCPMLDSETKKCLIYEDRPQQCQAFPAGPIEGCAISSD